MEAARSVDAATWTTWTSLCGRLDGFSKEHSASSDDSVVARRDQHVLQRGHIDRDSEQRAAKMSKRAAWPVDPKRLDALGVLLAFLKKQGTHVTIAITPFHPASGKAAWLALREQSRLDGRARSRNRGDPGARSSQLDPGPRRIQASNMRDFIHPDEICLKRVFRDIPVKD